MRDRGRSSCFGDVMLDELCGATITRISPESSSFFLFVRLGGKKNHQKFFFPKRGKKFFFFRASRRRWANVLAIVRWAGSLFVGVVETIPAGARAAHEC